MAAVFAVKIQLHHVATWGCPPTRITVPDVYYACPSGRRRNAMPRGPRRRTWRRPVSPALERQVVPHPVHRHHGAIAETNQVVDVCDAPDEPTQQAGELQPVHLYNCAIAPDRRDRTEVAVAKWRERL